MQTYEITKSNNSFERIKIMPEDGAISAETCRRKRDNTRIVSYTCILLVYYRHFIQKCTKWNGSRCLITVLISIIFSTLKIHELYVAELNIRTL